MTEDKDVTLGDILRSAVDDLNHRDKYAPKPHPDQHLQFYLDIPLKNLVAVCIRNMPYEDFVEIADSIGADHTKMWGWASEIRILLEATPLASSDY